MRNQFYLIFLSAILASCGSSTLGGAGSASDVTVVSEGGLPEPLRVDLFEQNRPYLIGPFDKLIIDVFGIEELSKKEVQTDAGGRISFPLAGILEAAGKTPGELETELEQRLRGQYVRDPQVTVNLKETVSQVITVDARSRSPGRSTSVGNRAVRCRSSRAICRGRSTIRRRYAPGRRREQRDARSPTDR